MNPLESSQRREQDNFYTECFEKNETIGEVYVTFAKLPTAEKKFLYIFDQLKKHNKLPTKCEPTNLKNNNEARKIRTEANEIFKEKDYVTALCKYNKSVMTAKINSQDYAFALANRSAALYYLEEYEACISDIRHSLAAKYPNELAYKLYEREIKCLEKMGNISEAKLKFKVSRYNCIGAYKIIPRYLLIKKSNIKNQLILYFIIYYIICILYRHFYLI